LQLVGRYYQINNVGNKLWNSNAEFMSEVKKIMNLLLQSWRDRELSLL
jgi:hypothetical protein